MNRTGMVSLVVFAMVAGMGMASMLRDSGSTALAAAPTPTPVAYGRMISLGTIAMSANVGSVNTPLVNVADCARVRAMVEAGAGNGGIQISTVMTSPDGTTRIVTRPEAEKTLGDTTGDGRVSASLVLEPVGPYASAASST